jgi:hypothetical protein
MPDIFEQSVAQSFQTAPKAEQGAFLLHWLVRSGMNVPAWWSPARDVALRSFWKTSDHVSGTLYTMQSKMTSIPFRVLARDPSNKEDVRRAEQWTDRLQSGAEWGEGWVTFFARWVEDLLTQDNGAFAEIIGAGPPDGPIVGTPVTVRHLDAARCQRTGDPRYPVIYHDITGKMFKVHYSRLLSSSQMTSPAQEMFGVGFCAVSRAINSAQALVDILTYKQEKLGSRPRRAVAVTRGGLDPEDVKKAFDMVESEMDSQGLSRYSKIALVGDSSIPEAAIDMIDMASLPDGFDQETDFNLGVAILALAFGLDARELAPALVSGATRADALLQHLKQRGKGPGQIIQTTEQLFDFRVLPRYLQLVFDFQDDEQDRQAAETKEVRSRRWRTSIDSHALDERVSRQQMIEVGDLDRAQYEYLELQDGRLPDGTDVLGLFTSQDPEIRGYLRLGLADFNPFDVDVNEDILPAIYKKMLDTQKVIVNGSNQNERFKATQAFYALKALEKRVQGAQEIGPEPVKPGDLPVKDERMRKISPITPNRTAVSTGQKLEPDSDDDVKEAANGETDWPFR